jgi:two-component system CitB family response regulator
MGIDPPNGISAITVDRVIDVARSSPDGEVSAADIADSTGMSVVTARRYVRYLAQIGSLQVSCRYGKVGAPERVYRLVDESDEDRAGHRSSA